MRNSLTNIYENMYSKKVVEPIVESNETFSKFDLSDYTEIIYEGKSGHGDEKIVINMLKDGIKNNLITVKETNHGWMVRSVNDPTKQELIHRGERAYHYLRRFIQKLS
jgi:hypothetical protein